MLEMSVKAKSHNLVVVSAFIALVGCVSADTPDQTALTTLTQTSKTIVSDDTQTEQISPTPGQLSSDAYEVSQITADDRSREYTFADVEGDDPCLTRETQDLVQCSLTPLGDGSGLTAGQKRNEGTALSELQAFTPNVIDPSTFDADRAADEVGRPGRRLQSQIGMAVGADFLAPTPPPPEPEQAPEDAIGQHRLPPIIHLPGSAQPQN